MYKNRQVKWMFALLVISMVILSFKFIIVKNKFIECKNNKVITVTKVENVKISEKFGYGDILECLRKNKDFNIESINMMENEKCNVEVNYKGSLNLLYNSLIKLSKSANFLNVSKIMINNDTKVTNICINFKKNK